MPDDPRKDDDSPEGAPPTPEEPFDPSTRERRAVSINTDTFMAVPAPVPDRPFEPPELEEKEGRLGISTAFFSIATAFSRVAGLVP